MEYLTDVEKDALLGCLNISMGSASTALATLLDKTVFITSPKLDEVSLDDVMSGCVVPCIYVDVSYIEGLGGGNVFVFKENDVMILNNLLNDIAPEDGLLAVDDVQDSVVGEAINKMVGFSVTAMSEMLDRVIAINPPVIGRLLPSAKEFPAPSLAGTEGKVLQATFILKVEELVDSTLILIIPLDAARELARALLDDLNRSMELPEQEMADTDADDAATLPDAGSGFSLTPEEGDDVSIAPETEGEEIPDSAAEKMDGILQPEPEISPETETDEEINRIIWSKENPDLAGKKEKTLTLKERMQKLEMVKDIPIELTVVLGKNVLPMGDLFSVGKGSLVPLRRYAKEPVDVLVNDQMVAKGEIVVVDGKLGVRITSIESKLPKMLQKGAVK
ncbi:MAG: flagellar motor switch phosphatase FliY [Firmicutes bacterium]|jgi:flagellar motor switch protein FliN/FliY|nr:flagellar motor switch phosphatase FliY [Bacillota bacterium]